MSKVNINYGSGTIIFTALLCLCKVTGVLNVSWWWCFCLFWLPFVAIFGIIGLFAIISVPFLIVALLIEILSNR